MSKDFSFGVKKATEELSQLNWIDYDEYAV